MSHKSNDIVAYTDASFAEDVITRKSTSGYVFMKNNGAISWAARSQPKVAHSSADSELRALDECVRETRWLQRLDAEFYPARNTGRPGNRKPITLYEDNRPCIKWIENPCAHSKVKHIDVPLNFIRDDVTVGKTIDLQYINTKAQLADLFTKQLSPKVHWNLLVNIMNIPRQVNKTPPCASLPTAIAPAAATAPAAAAAAAAVVQSIE